MKVRAWVCFRSVLLAGSVSQIIDKKKEQKQGAKDLKELEMLNNLFDDSGDEGLASIDLGGSGKNSFASKRLKELDDEKRTGKGKKRAKSATSDEGGSEDDEDSEPPAKKNKKDKNKGGAKIKQDVPSARNRRSLLIVLLIC